MNVADTVVATRFGTSIVPSTRAAMLPEVSRRRSDRRPRNRVGVRSVSPAIRTVGARGSHEYVWSVLGNAPDHEGCWVAALIRSRGRRHIRVSAANAAAHAGDAGSRCDMWSPGPRPVSASLPRRAGGDIQLALAVGHRVVDLRLWMHTTGAFQRKVAHRIGYRVAIGNVVGPASEEVGAAVPPTPACAAARRSSTPACEITPVTAIGRVGTGVSSARVPARDRGPGREVAAGE